MRSGYIYKCDYSRAVAGIFVSADLDQCDYSVAEMFGGAHKCHQETTEVSDRILLLYLSMSLFWVNQYDQFQWKYSYYLHITDYQYY